MSKAELVEYIATNGDMTKADASRALESVLEGIKHGLKTNGKVTLVGFGTFEAKRREAREGRNPATGETLQIPAKTVATFKAGSKLKEELN